MPLLLIYNILPSQLLSHCVIIIDFEQRVSFGLLISCSNFLFQHVCIFTGIIVVITLSFGEYIIFDYIAFYLLFSPSHTSHIVPSCIGCWMLAHCTSLVHYFTGSHYYVLMLTDPFLGDIKFAVNFILDIFISCLFPLIFLNTDLDQFYRYHETT